MAGHTDKFMVEVDEFFGTVEIAGKRCGVDDCGREPVYAMPIRTPEETGVWWFCREHADEAVEKLGSDPKNPISEIVPTCGGPGSGSPCGAAATHLAIVGVQGMGLQLISLCERHAQEVGQ